MIKKRTHRKILSSESVLKQLRDEFGMSQEEFARQIGTSGRTISRWEVGETTPTFTIAQVKALIHLLQLKGKSIEELPDNLGPIEYSEEIEEEQS